METVTSPDTEVKCKRPRRLSASVQGDVLMQDWKRRFGLKHRGRNKRRARPTALTSEPFVVVMKDLVIIKLLCISVL